MPEPLVADALREVHVGERVDEPESRPLDDVAKPSRGHERHGVSAAGQFAAHADERVDVTRAAQGEEHCMQRSLVDHPLLLPHADRLAALPAAGEVGRDLPMIADSRADGAATGQWSAGEYGRLPAEAPGQGHHRRQREPSIRSHKDIARTDASSNHHIPRNRPDQFAPDHNPPHHHTDHPTRTLRRPKAPQEHSQAWRCWRCRMTAEMELIVAAAFLEAYLGGRI